MVINCKWGKIDQIFMFSVSLDYAKTAHILYLKMAFDFF